MLVDVERRLLFSVLVAIPSVFVSFALADSVRAPNFLRYLIAPGYVVSLNLRLSFRYGCLARALDERGLLCVVDFSYFNMVLPLHQERTELNPLVAYILSGLRQQK